MDVDTHTPPSASEPGHATALVTIHEPRVAIGDRGAGWLMAGWDNFRAAPGQWLSLCLVGFIILCVINFIPVANFLNAFLSQVWIAGVMTACHAQHNGQPVRVSHLFAGFGPKATALVLSQVIIAGLQLLIAIPLLGSLFYNIYAGDFYSYDVQGPIDPGQILASIDAGSAALHIAIALALALPLVAAGWFAPALILLGNKSIKEALLLSLTGCFRNTWPFLVYGLCGLILCILSLFTVGLALIVIVPMVYSSIYVSFREIFVD